MNHYLSLLLFLPVVGAIAVRYLPPRLSALTARSVVLAGCAALIPVWSWYRPTSPDLQLTDRVAFISRLGLAYSVGIDGISLAFLVLAGIVCSVATWLPAPERGARRRRHFAWLVAHYGALLGVFLSADALLFALSWAVALLTLWQLVGRGEDPQQADTWFRGQASGMLGAMAYVTALVALTRLATSSSVFGVATSGGVPPGAVQAWAALVLLVGWTAAVLVPCALMWNPFARTHDAFSEMPPAAVLLLMAATAKVGVYGVGRFAWPLVSSAAPLIAHRAPGLVFGVAAVSAAVAGVQSRWVRFIAAVSLSYAAMSLAACLTLTPAGLSSGIELAVVHALVMAAAVAVVWAGESRAGRGFPLAERQLTTSPALAVAVFLTTLVAGIPAWRAGAGQVPTPLWSALALLGMLVGQGIVAARGRVAWQTSPIDLRLSGRSRGGLGLASVAVLVAAVAVWVGMHPSQVSTLLRVPTLKLAAAVDASYQSEFVAACDTTVTADMKAASPAAQFLAAAPCGPDGKPLVGSVSTPLAGSVVK